MLFYTLPLQCYQNNCQRERRWYISKEKTEEKQKSVTIMISVDGKGTVCLVKLKLEWESFE